METIIITVLLIFVALLILVMFFFLKKTVAKVNQQSRDFFVDKLQAYDDLINEREEKLKGLKEDIKLKEEELKENRDLRPTVNSVYLYDLKNIDYQDDKIFKKMKEVDQKFNVDPVKLVKRFLKEYFHEDTVMEYNKYDSVRRQFDKEKVYKLISMRQTEQEKEVRRILRDLDYILDDFKKKNRSFEIKRFLSYFDKIMDKVDPYVYVYVGSKNENFDNLNQYIRTKVDDNIYKGVSIIYKGKLYDYSLK